MWFFLFCMILLIPVVMVVFGNLFKKSAPGKVNMIYGYRTSMSMKNQDTWEFAHKYCGKVWSSWGMALLLFSAAVMAFVFGKSEGMMGNAAGALCILQVVVLIVSVYPTERALRQNFDQDRKRRDALK